MPLGVAICFGPAMIVYWLTHRDKSESEEKSDRH